MSASTQEHIPIKDIQQNVVLLKSGSAAIVLETSAVNFGLLSENEQLAIISSFAGLLNSLSFMIQIVVRSKRLNITSYLLKLEAAKKRQSNPLMTQMIENYTAFIKNTIQENEVLDKQFFIVVPVSYLELGLGKNPVENFKKALTLLLPRRDHLFRQLSRLGLKATQLNNERLTKLFYDIYNEEDRSTEQLPIRVTPQIQPQIPTQAATYQPQPTKAPPTQTPIAPIIDRPQTPTPQIIQRANRPFVVEELADDYGTV